MCACVDALALKQHYRMPEGARSQAVLLNSSGWDGFNPLNLSPNGAAFHDYCEASSDLCDSMLAMMTGYSALSQHKCGKDVCIGAYRHPEYILYKTESRCCTDAGKLERVRLEKLIKSRIRRAHEERAPSDSDDADLEDESIAQAKLVVHGTECEQSIQLAAAPATALECAELALVGCQSSTFMHSKAYPEWGCRCCKDDHEKVYLDGPRRRNKYWTLWRAITPEKGRRHRIVH